MGLRIRIIRVNIKYVGLCFLVVVLGVVTLEVLFDIKEIFFSIVGRDATLTGRTDIWRMVLDVDINPFIGTGYESFWLGDRLEKLRETYIFLNSSHNGYLETYLNLGVIGLCLLAAVLVSIYRKIKKGLELDFDFGVFRLAIFILILVHNITEASLKALSLQFFILLLIGVEVPRLLKGKR